MEIGLINFIAEIKFLLDCYLHPTLFHTISTRNKNTDSLVKWQDHFTKALFSCYLLIKLKLTKILIELKLYEYQPQNRWTRKKIYSMALLKGNKMERLAGIGVAIPYNLESRLRELNLPSNTFSSWANIDFAEELEQASNTAVYGENDGTAAAVAELLYGVGREPVIVIVADLGGGLTGVLKERLDACAGCRYP